MIQAISNIKEEKAFLTRKPEKDKPNSISIFQGYLNRIRFIFTNGEFASSEALQIKSALELTGLSLYINRNWRWSQKPTPSIGDLQRVFSSHDAVLDYDRLDNLIVALALQTTNPVYVPKKHCIRISSPIWSGEIGA